MEHIPYVLYPLVPVTSRWCELLKQIESHNLYNQALKEAWIEAIVFLRGEVGIGFFDTCGVNHPLNLKLNSFGEGQVKELVEWVHLLKTLKPSESNYDLFLQKLKSKSKSRIEAFPFLEIVKGYIQGGFHVRFLEEINSQKTPDIEIVSPIASELFYLEVSRINDTEERTNTSKQFNQISDAVNAIGFDIPYAIKQHLPLTDEQIQLIRDQIKLLKDDAWTGEKLAYWESSEITMAFVHPKQHDELLTWCKDKGIRKGLFGLPVNFNDTARVIRQRKIREKASQIPETSTGILYFPVQFPYMAFMNKLEAFESFEKELEEFPNIYGLVLYTEAIVPLQELVQIDSAHIYWEKQTISGSVRYLMFVQNPAYNGTLSEETILKIRSAIKEL